MYPPSESTHTQNFKPYVKPMVSQKKTILMGKALIHKKYNIYKKKLFKY